MESVLPVQQQDRRHLQLAISRCASSLGQLLCRTIWVCIQVALLWWHA